MELSIAAVISAAGSSSRMGGRKKEYLPLETGNPLTVLGAAVKAFASVSYINPIVIVIPRDSENGENAAKAGLPPELLAGTSGGPGRVCFVTGGRTRRASVYNALDFLKSFSPSHVLIHDGARPWIKKELIERITEAVIRHGAVIPALPLVETPKELDGGEGFGVSRQAPEAEPVFIGRHLRRAELCTAQTPQAFRFPEILRAHEKAAEKEEREGREYTDDAEVWAEFIGQVAVIPGDPENRKITFPEDLARGISPGEGERTTQRIGMGRDLHRLVSGRRFLLGGVEIPFEKGELGHSDGDALAHAVTDALLGAAGLGDIGELYPPGDETWKDANSLVLLKNAWNKVKAGGWRLVNIDCTVTCEKPKLLPHRDNIRRSLAEALDVDSSRVFVKGKTNEGLGPLGTGEAVEALAVCLLEKQGSL